MRVLINAKKAKGFTLLELMLVLVLLTTLAMAGLAMYQIQLRNFRVDKTALQMQQWMQASLAFYVDCHKWPDPLVDPQIMQKMMGSDVLTSDDCANPNYIDKIRVYMPAGSDQNGPWMNRYEIVGGSALNNSPSLTLRTNIGQYSNSLYNSGKMIAARLPVGNVFAAGRDVIVRASVVEPASAIVDNSRGFILNMQVVQANTVSNVKKPQDSDCPTGMKATLTYALSSIQSGQDPYIKPWFSLYGLYQGLPDVSAVNNQNYITPQLKPRGNCSTLGDCSAIMNPENNKILLISACIPASSPKNTKTMTSDENYRF